MTPDELADRTRRAVAAAVAAARGLGLDVAHGEVLHDVFSVVVHLEPQPVVARIPVVLTAGTDPEHQAARQQRELDVAAWLDDRGVAVIAPSPRVPRRPVRRGGFGMTFWELADVADDHEPYRGVDVSFSAKLHAELAQYPRELPFLSPFNDGLPDLLDALDTADGLTTRDIDRAHSEFESLQTLLADRAAFSRAFPDVTVHAIQGDGPSHNVIRTRTGIAFADFEDVTCGPVEWDLAMLGQQTTLEYGRAAVELGIRVPDAEVQSVMDRARRLQFVACHALVPQLPVLAAGLAAALDEWRDQIGS